MTKREAVFAASVANVGVVDGVGGCVGRAAEAVMCGGGRMRVAALIRRNWHGDCIWCEQPRHFSVRVNACTDGSRGSSEGQRVV